MMERTKIKRCPICGNKNIEHKLGDHVSKLRGITHNVPQTVCHNFGEIFLGSDSLSVIRSNDVKIKHNLNIITS